MYMQQELDKLSARSAPIPLNEIVYENQSYWSEPVDGNNIERRNQRGIADENDIIIDPIDNVIYENQILNPPPIVYVNIAQPQGLLFDNLGPEGDIGICRVLVESPFDTLNRPDLTEGFCEMLTNLLAPKYKFLSVTTILAILPLITYIILSFSNRAPFLKLPYFSIQAVNLTPYRLNQFQFYRLYTAPFVFKDLNETLLNTLLIWVVGSNVEDIFGWKIICVLIGLPGLVGASTNICFFMVGLHCSYMILQWPNPNVNVNIRRVQITIYAIITLLFLLLLLTQERVAKLSILSSIIYGFLFGFIIGVKNDREQNSFKKLTKFISTTLVIFITSGMLCMIIFSKKTVV